MTRKANVVVVGSINMDLVVHSPKLPVAGETVLGEDYFEMPGGKGANQAVAASRLGANVEMFGCLGNDLFGQKLLRQLQVEGVGTSHIFVLPEHASGVALIAVNPEGENFIIVSPGANMQLSPDHIAQGEEVIRNADVLLVQLEIPLETVYAALQMAKKYDVVTILNPAPAKSLPNEFFRLTDIITPNETEGNLLATGDPQKQSTLEEIIIGLKKLGVNDVMLTRGGDGLAYSYGNNVDEVPACKVDAIDTTAAGDACNAGLAVALAEGMAFPDAIKFAVKVSALTVTKFGAQPSLPFRNEVSEFVCRS